MGGYNWKKRATIHERRIAGREVKRETVRSVMAHQVPASSRLDKFATKIIDWMLDTDDDAIIVSNIIINVLVVAFWIFVSCIFWSAVNYWIVAATYAAGFVATKLLSNYLVCAKVRVEYEKRFRNYESAPSPDGAQRIIETDLEKYPFIVPTNLVLAFWFSFLPSFAVFLSLKVLFVFLGWIIVSNNKKLITKEITRLTKAKEPKQIVAGPNGYRSFEEKN